MPYVLIVLALVAVAFGKEVSYALALVGLLGVVALCLLLVGAVVVTLWPPVGIGIMAVAGGSLLLCGGHRVAGAVRQAKQQEARRVAAEAEKKTQAAWLESLRKDLATGDMYDVLATSVVMTERGWFHLAFPVLRAHLFETSEETRLHAAEGLAWTDKAHSGRCAELLVERLDDMSESARVRAQAALVLSRIGSPVGLPALMRHLKDTDGGVRAACCRGVGAVLSSSRNQGHIWQDDAQRAVARLTKIVNLDPCTLARIEAAHALGIIGDVRALRTLQAVADDATQAAQLREVAAEAVGRIRAGSGRGISGAAA